MSSKKGDISVQVVVLAIVALLVLVLLIFIATGRLSGVNKGLGDCSSKGGDCKPGDRCPGNWVPLEVGDCGEGSTCCIKPLA